MFELNVQNQNIENLSLDAQENIRNRVFRVFISSPFIDMQRERDRLVQDVFPRFRKLCKERDVEFVPIDLRWGVTEEQASTGKTVGICLREIQRSFPFFIGLSGERYGWIPEEKNIDEHDFQEFQFLKECIQNGLSITEIEFLFAISQSTTNMNAMFLIRSEKMESSREYQDNGDEIKRRKLVNLKVKLYAQEKYPVFEYDSPKDLGERVEKVLNQWLDKYFTQGEKRTWIQKQDVDQYNFEHNRKRLYVENKKDYERLNTFIKFEERTPLAVVGVSGTGKSTLFANWKEVCTENFPNVMVITHYVAASPDSDLPANILRRLTETLDPTFATKKEPQIELKFEQKTLDDFSNELSSTVAQYLAENPEKRLLFIIDGLNQLSEIESAKELNWLPTLPTRAQYVISTVFSDDAFKTVKRREWNIYEIHELDNVRRKEIIKGFQKITGKTLSPDQERKISNFPLSSNPLCLKTLLDELCFFGNYEKFDNEIDRYVQVKDVDEFFNKVFERIETNEQFIEINPDRRKMIIEELALLLVLSRFGLTENELRYITGLPLLTISTFLCMLDVQLVVRSGRYSFAHDYIRQAVLKRYAPKIDETRRLIITRFLELESDDERRLQEVPFQYLQLKSWEELRLFLLDFDVLGKLYNGTFNCDFCMYWNDALRNGRKEFEFDPYLRLKPFEPSDWFNLAHIAQVYTDFSTAEKAYQGTKKILYELIKENSPAYKPNLAVTLNNLANLYSDINLFDEAEKEYQEALTLYRELAEENSYTHNRDIALALNNLANLHKKVNRFFIAEGELKESLKIQRELTLEKNIGIEVLVKTLNNYADLLLEMNRFDEAENNFRKALALCRKQVKESPNMFKSYLAETLDSLAYLHINTRSWDEAEKEFQEALEIRWELTQDNPNTYIPDLAITLDNLAFLHYSMNCLDKSEKEFEEALEIRRQLAKVKPNAYNPDFARSLNNLANFQYFTKRFDEAKENYKEALKIRRNLAAENPEVYYSDVAETLNNLANLHKDVNRFNEAEDEYKEALKIRRELANENPDVYKSVFAGTLNNLASLHSDMNCLGEAKKEFEESLKIYRELVEENPDEHMSEHAEILNNFGNLLRKSKRFCKAEEKYREALKIRRKLEEENPNTCKYYIATTLNNLANLSCYVNRFDEAEKGYEETLTLYRELAEENPNTYKTEVAKTLFNMSILYFKLGKFTVARQLISEAISIYAEYAGTNVISPEQLRETCLFQEEIHKKICSIKSET